MKALNLAVRILLLLALVFVLLFVLTWSNTVKCKSIPMWCDVFYAVRGKPDVLIVYGDSGLGNPELLADSFRNPNIVGVYAKQMRLDSANLGNLKNYQLVIVTRARKMGSKKIEMFMDYVIQGGNLVWTGDAGTEAESDSEYMRESDYYADSNSSATVSPWARNTGDGFLLFNEFLSVDYVSNYCSLKKCSRDKSYYIGMLEMVERDNPLVYGFNNLQLEVLDREDFAVVRSLSEGTSTSVMTFDFGSNLVAENRNYGNHLPMIVTNAKSSLAGVKLGENIYYYAMPPEYFVNPKIPEEKRYGLFLRKLYYGIIYG